LPRARCRNSPQPFPSHELITVSPRSDFLGVQRSSVQLTAKIVNFAMVCLEANAVASRATV
jgi:hypothetical protein